ncbi:LuxR C-terminal-related transcriptional regulator [Arenibaculum pallidiluteum]|uniref:LuxR C-terminal-related transcriptional regulator n=1 Tax=Arenibaculum pallidiluteum TaxID=2812559 RepID=UPI001A95BF37|nr:response regulator transcription factor [Arenibaculum pallidiluteum]
MGNTKVFVHHRTRLHEESIFELLKSTEFQRIPTGETRGVPSEPPDLFITDLALFRRNVKALQDWCQSPARIVFVADDFSLGDLRLALRLGANGYVLNRLSSEAFVMSLRLVMAGEKVFPTELTREIFSREFKRKNGSRQAAVPSDPALERIRSGAGIEFTRRDLRIIDMIASGVGNREIAGSIQVTEDLVKMYVRQIMKRINASNRTQVAIWAVQHGVVRQEAALVD